MAITQAICDTFKRDLLQGRHTLTVLTGTNPGSSVAAAGGPNGPNGLATPVYTGTFTNGASDAYAGLVMQTTGFGTAGNNGTFLCIRSTATTIELCNPNGANSGGMGTINTTMNVFAIALFPSTSTMDNTTTKFGDVSGEVGSSGTYVTGGIGPGGNLVGNAMALVSTTPVTNGSGPGAGCALFATISWTTATITARGALIYNASLGSTKSAMPSVLVLSFTTDQTSTAGTFTITFPAQTKGNAIIQLT